MQKKYAALAMFAMMMASVNANAEGKDGLAAEVNGVKITVAEVKKAYESNQKINSSVPFDEFYPKALEFFVKGKVISQAAANAKVADSAEYKEQLEIAKEELARKIYLEQQLKNKVTDASVNKVYDDYKAKFQGQKEVKARHILVDDEKVANDVIAQLKKGAKFNDLAKKYSKDEADLGYFTKNMMVPEFGNAAFSMKKGQYSDKPVKTKFGYHVIIVDDIRDAKPQPLKEVKPQIENMLTQQALADVLDNLEKQAKVTKYGLDGKELAK